MRDLHPSPETTAAAIRQQSDALAARLQTIHTTLSGAASAALETYGTGLAHQTTNDVYFDALGALPPVFNRDGFWMGEPYSHDPDGCETALQFWTEHDGPGARYFCRYSRVGDGQPPRGRLISFA